MQASCLKKNWRTTPLYFQNSFPWDKLRKLKYDQQITARFEASTHVELLRSLESSILQLLNHWSSDSVGWITCGPQIGKRPLHLVFAFWRAALSHSSRPRASLLVKTNVKNSLDQKNKTINIKKQHNTTRDVTRRQYRRQNCYNTLNICMTSKQQ